MRYLPCSKFFKCIQYISSKPTGLFFWFSMMPLLILELPKNIHWKLQIFPFAAIFQILLYKTCKKMISTRKNLQFWMNIFWEFWNNLWYQGVPEKCHRSFVDAISPDKICFFKIGIVFGEDTRYACYFWIGTYLCYLSTPRSPDELCTIFTILLTIWHSEQKMGY